MADEKVMRHARSVYATICETFDDRNWSYDRDDEELIIRSGVQGDDLPMHLRIKVEPNLQIVSLYSHLPFDISEDDLVMMSVAVCAANLNMVNGNFDFNIRNGNLLFRMTSSFKESLLSKEMFEYMIDIACMTVDHYNDKFEMLVKHEITLEDFVNYTKE